MDGDGSEDAVSKITLIRLDSSLKDKEKQYFDTLAETKAVLDENTENMYRITVGNETGIGNIENNAFQNCTNLYSIKLNSSLLNISSSAFSGCTGLKIVDISEGVLAIGQQAFKGCTALEEIELPQSLRQLGNMSFTSCSSLKSISIPSGIQEIPQMCFASCGLEEINFSEGLVSIGVSAFRDCYGLSSVSFPSTLRAIGNFAFSLDNNYDINTNTYAHNTLQEIILNNGLASIGNSAFRGCTVTEINIPSTIMSISSVSSNESFIQCYRLTEIIVNQAENSITGSPWGATNATVTWTG